MNFNELLPFYVLGVLSDEEHNWMSNYIDHHPEVWAEVEELQSDVMVLDHSAESVDPSPQVKQQLMQRISREPVAAPVAPAPTSRIQEVPANQQDRRRSRFAFPMLALAAALAAFFWAGSLRQQLNSQQQIVANQQIEIDTLSNQNGLFETSIAAAKAEEERLTTELTAVAANLDPLHAEIAALTNTNNQLTAQLEQQQDVAALEQRITELEAQANELQTINDALREQLDDQQVLLAVYQSPRVQTTQVAGTEVQPDAIGHLSINLTTETAAFNAWQLGPIDSDQQAYQLWLIDEEGPQGVGLLDLSKGWGQLTFTSDIVGDYSAIGLTIEPAGGSDAPTSDIVMLGTR